MSPSNFRKERVLEKHSTQAEFMCFKATCICLNSGVASMPRALCYVLPLLMSWYIRDVFQLIAHRSGKLRTFAAGQERRRVRI